MKRILSKHFLISFRKTKSVEKGSGFDHIPVKMKILTLDTNFTHGPGSQNEFSYSMAPNSSFNCSVNSSEPCHRLGDEDNTTVFADYSLPPHTQGILVIMYSAVTFLALGGNAIVCYIVLAYQRMRTVTNYFIVNLALSDILMAILCIPFSFIANMIFHYWPFGAVMCPVVTYAQTVAVFASAFTLVAISLDRYIAIMYPLRPKMTTRQAFIVIATIWILALSVPLPVAILSRITIQEDHEGVSREYCDEQWPEYHQRAAFSTSVMVLQYFLPLFILMFTYTRIGVIIWVKKMPGEAESNRDQRMAASKRKVGVDICENKQIKYPIDVIYYIAKMDVCILLCSVFRFMCNYSFSEYISKIQ